MTQATSHSTFADELDRRAAERLRALDPTESIIKSAFYLSKNVLDQRHVQAIRNAKRPETAIMRRVLGLYDMAQYTNGKENDARLLHINGQILSGLTLLRKGLLKNPGIDDESKALELIAAWLGTKEKGIVSRSVTIRSMHLGMSHSEAHLAGEEHAARAVIERRAGHGTDARWAPEESLPERGLRNRPEQPCNPLLAERVMVVAPQGVAMTTKEAERLKKDERDAALEAKLGRRLTVMERVYGVDDTQAQAPLRAASPKDAAEGLRARFSGDYAGREAPQREAVPPREAPAPTSAIGVRRREMESLRTNATTGARPTPRPQAAPQASPSATNRPIITGARIGDIGNGLAGLASRAAGATVGKVAASVGKAFVRKADRSRDDDAR